MTKPLNDKIVAPYMPAPKGNFGFLGTLLYDDVEDKIQCHECGEWYKSVSAHISFHGLRAREYKEKFELNYGTALNIPSLGESHSIRAEFFNKLNFGKISKKEIKARAKKMSKLSNEVKKARREQGVKTRWTIEMMNRYGSCPRQVEERFTTIVDELGHTPTWDEMHAKDAALLAILHRRFKGYGNALEYFGLKGKRRFYIANYGRASIEMALKKFIDDNKRLPNPKDTKMGFLPDYTTISRYFDGGWNEAKRWCFEYLEKKYKKESRVYDEKLRRISIQAPSMSI